MSFEIKPGSDTIPITIDGQVAEIPLNHQFRVFESLEPNQVYALASQASRGEWIDNNTLLVKSINLGEVVGFHGEIEFRVVFSKNEIDVTSKYVVTGQETTYHGKRTDA